MSYRHKVLQDSSFFVLYASFSLYLFHEPVLFFMMKKAGFAQPHSLSDLLLKSALIIPVVILFAALTYYTVEKPFFAKRVKYT